MRQHNLSCPTGYCPRRQLDACRVRNDVGSYPQQVPISFLPLMPSFAAPVQTPSTHVSATSSRAPTTLLLLPRGFHSPPLTTFHGCTSWLPL